MKRVFFPSNSEYTYLIYYYIYATCVMHLLHAFAIMTSGRWGEFGD